MGRRTPIIAMAFRWPRRSSGPRCFLSGRALRPAAPASLWDRGTSVPRRSLQSIPPHPRRGLPIGRAETPVRLLGRDRTAETPRSRRERGKRHEPEALGSSTTLHVVGWTSALIGEATSRLPLHPYPTRYEMSGYFAGMPAHSMTKARGAGRTPSLVCLTLALHCSPEPAPRAGPPYRCRGPRRRLRHPPAARARDEPEDAVAYRLWACHHPEELLMTSQSIRSVL